MEENSHLENDHFSKSLIQRERPQERFAVPSRAWQGGQGVNGPND